MSMRNQWTLLLLTLSAVLFQAGPLSAQIPVLLYHAHTSMSYTDAMFREHMDFLNDNGYHTITLDQLYEWRVNSAPLPLRPVAVTIDDNYILLYTSAWPILASNGQVATNFAHSSFVGVPGANDHCDWSEINQMEISGAVLTESHSRTHPNLTTLDAVQLESETAGSKADIEINILSKTCSHFAYPGGAYNQTVIDACIAAGYRLGFSTIQAFTYRDDPLFEMPRLGVDGASLAGFRNTIGFNDLPPAPPGEGWILDNAEPHCFYDDASWSPSTSPEGYYNTDCLTRIGGATAPLRWAASLPQGGLMRLYARWSAAPDRVAGATFTIQHADGISTTTVDQRDGGGLWNDLGLFRFEETTPVEVILDGPTEGVLVGDAVWFEPEPSTVSGWRLY